MAILFADNYETYGTGDSSRLRMLDGIYAEISEFFTSVEVGSDPDPLDSGRCLITGISAGQNYARIVYPGGDKDVAGVTMKVWVNELPPSEDDTTHYFNFEDASGNRLAWIYLMPTGAIRVRQANQPSILNNTIIATSAPAITAGAWNTIEFKMTRDSGAGDGALVIRVNSVDILNLAGVDWVQTNNAIGSFEWGNVGTGGSLVYTKDFILWDTNGTQNNDFIGNSEVITLFPDGDDTFAGWTTSSGSTGFNLIDEDTPDDADYIQADDTPPAAVEFTLTNLPPDIVGIKAVLPFARTQKIDGGDGNIQLSIDSNGSEDAGANNAVTTAFTYRWDVSELSPDTGSAYTPLEVDGLKLKIDRTV